MTFIQLEFNFSNASETEQKLIEMKKKIDEKCESMDKVRKKVFAENGELKKIVQLLKIEIEELKKLIFPHQNENVEFLKTEKNSLFDVSEHQECVG